MRNGLQRNLRMYQHSQCNKEANALEFEIIIPEQYEELLEKKAAEQGITVEELLESAIRKFLERKKETNGN